MCIYSEIAPEFKILYNIPVIMSHSFHNPTPLKYTTLVFPSFLLLNTFFLFSFFLYFLFFSLYLTTYSFLFLEHL